MDSAVYSLEERVKAIDLGPSESQVISLCNTNWDGTRLS